MRSRARAFTLIELLVVISIISLLSSVVLASLNTAREKGRIGAATHFAAQVDHLAGDQAVGIWDLDECAASTTYDRSGFGNTGTLNSGASWSSDTPSGKGCSMSFNGSSQNVTAGNGSALNFGTGDFSFSLWVKTSDNSNYKGLISKGATVAADPGFKTTMISGANNLRVDVANGTAYVISNMQSTAVITDNKWHQVVFAGARTGSGSLYVDGKLNATQAFSDAGAPTSISGGAVFSIGSETGSRYLIGLVDAVRVYAKALTAREVGELYAYDQRTHPAFAILDQ